MLEPHSAVTTSPPSTRPVGDAAVALLNPLHEASWDEGLADCRGALFFHGAAWARTLHEAYGYQPAFFALRDAGRLHSVLPVMEVDSWLTGRRGIALPFTDECPPLCRDAESFRRLFAAALHHARARGWKYLEFRGGKSLFGEDPASTSFYGHRLALSAGEAGLFARVDGSVRRAIRKAGQQGGLSLEFSHTLDAMRDFYRLTCLTRQRHGVPPQPFRFFRRIHANVIAPQRGCIVLARLGSRPVAGAVFFHDRNSAFYKFGASDENYQHLRANNLVMWEAIKWHARQGLSALDFGRTSLGNEGLRRFKLGWGTEERRIEYVKYDLGRDAFVTARDASTGWHNAVFRHLPVFLARAAGAFLYKHIA